MAEPRFEDFEDAVAAADAAAGPLLPRRPREDTEMDITPMIDITFLLLIFFLVASKMDEGANLPLPPAKYGTPVPSKNSVIFTIARGENEQGAQVYKGNAIDPALLIDSSDLEALEDEVAAYVEEEMASDRRKQFVLIKADEKVKHRDVARVERAIGRVAEVQQLHVAVMEDTSSP